MAKITTTSNADLVLEPNGTGDLDINTDTIKIDGETTTLNLLDNSATALTVQSSDGTDMMVMDTSNSAEKVSIPATNGLVVNKVQPASGQSLVLNEDGGSAALTVDTSGNTTLAGTGNNIGTVTSGTFNGTFGDSATMSNKYWRTANLNASEPVDGSGEYINTSTSTNPYFAAGSGDTTNVVYTDTNNIKIVRAGVYMISFQGTFLYGGSSVARIVHVGIHLGGSVNPTSGVSGAYDQIANTDSSVDDYGSATAVWVGHCSANTYVRFWIKGYSSTTPYVQDSTSYSIALIRPT